LAIFLDANIPIYAAGGPHALKQPCIEILLHVADRPRGYWTDAEVLQELLHRYRARGRWTLGRTVLRNFAELMRDRIEPVHGADVDAAAELAGQMADVEARDLLHAAVMARTGSDLIATADRGFERVPNLRRLDPADIGRWRRLAEVG
jgi:predicted nucleic acid-binding protein